MHDIGHRRTVMREERVDAVHGFVGGFSHNQFALTIVEELEQRFSHTLCWFETCQRETLGGQDTRAHKAEASVGRPRLLEQCRSIDAAVFRSPTTRDRYRRRGCRWGIVVDRRVCRNLRSFPLPPPPPSNLARVRQKSGECRSARRGELLRSRIDRFAASVICCRERQLFAQTSAGN